MLYTTVSHQDTLNKLDLFEKMSAKVGAGATFSLVSRSDAITLLLGTLNSIYTSLRFRSFRDEKEWFSGVNVDERELGHLSG